MNCDEILRAEATPGIPLKVEIMHTVVCRTAAGFTSGPVLFRLRNWIRRLSSSSVCCNASLTAFSTSNRKGQCGKLYLPRSFFVRIRIKRSLSITFLQTLSSCAGVLHCRNTRNSDAAPADHGDCPKARTQKEIFTDGAAGGRSGSIFPHWAHGRPA